MDGKWVVTPSYKTSDAFALTPFCTLTGADAKSMSYRPISVMLHFYEIAESVNNAMAAPLAVTNCK